MLETIPVELNEAQSEALRRSLRDELKLALEVHEKREAMYASFLEAYKSRPKTAKKTFPWDGASNVVVPLVAITVDAIVSRLVRAMLGTKDFAEVEIKNPEWEIVEKDMREWLNNYVKVSGLKSRLRTVAFDMALGGDAYAIPVFVDETRTYHKYDEAGNVVALAIPQYSGVRWYVPSPSDVIFPHGFDEWGQLPWKAVRKRHTWAELKKKEESGEYTNVEAIRETKKQRDDKRKAVVDDHNTTKGEGHSLYEVYEITGLWEIPGREPEGDTPAVEASFEEVILTYSLDGDVLLRAIHNPFFGQPHMLVKIPFLHQAHEVQAMGVAEQAMPFQEEASTAHNQKIDAATAANAGLIVVTPDANFGATEELYPGKRIVTENPDKDVRVIHLSAPSPVSDRIEDSAAFLTEKRSGMSSYNLGMESSIVGSRATATGTTALISEGNIRQWVSIDDMRDALAELIYLTIQLEQQYRPEGHEYIKGKQIKFPQGDVRTSIGLTITITSEQINRDMELQNLQILMTVLNDYYARLSQAAMMMFNPQIPPPAKLVAFQIMMASQDLIRRFVERFDVENLETIVPNLADILQGVSGSGQGNVAGPAGPGQAGAPGGPGPGAGAGVQPVPVGGVGVGSPTGTGASTLPV
jgi:hypothetical protein